MKDIIISTVDINKDYTILGPVYDQVCNIGIFKSKLSKLKKEYADKIEDLKHANKWVFGEGDYGEAFFIITEELKKNAIKLGADAIIDMHQNLHYDDNLSFYNMQIYGTAVKFI